MKKLIEFIKKWYPVARDIIVAILAVIEGSKQINN